jgi:hypothetical protein
VEDVIIAGQAVVWRASVNTIISSVCATDIRNTKQIIPICIYQKSLICRFKGAAQNTRVVEISFKKLNSDRAADHQQKKEKDQDVEH